MTRRTPNHFLASLATFVSKDPLANAEIKLARVQDRLFAKIGSEWTDADRIELAAAFSAVEAERRRAW